MPTIEFAPHTGRYLHVSNPDGTNSLAIRTDNSPTALQIVGQPADHVANTGHVSNTGQSANLLYPRHTEGTPVFRLADTMRNGVVLRRGPSPDAYRKLAATIVNDAGNHLDADAFAHTARAAVVHFTAGPLGSRFDAEEIIAITYTQLENQRDKLGTQLGSEGYQKHYARVGAGILSTLTAGTTGLTGLLCSPFVLDRSIPMILAMASVSAVEGLGVNVAIRSAIRHAAAERRVAGKRAHTKACITALRPARPEIAAAPRGEEIV